MPRSSWIVFSFLMSLLLIGCSDGNSGAPSTSEAHPEGWIFTHGEEALDDGIDDCRSCHGGDLQGSGEAVSCFSCHGDQNSPQEPDIDFFQPHPWRGTPDLEHGDFARLMSWTRCANAACHGPQLDGGDFGPSCFLSGCHSGGPPAPHPFFVDPAAHGAAAQNDQILCRNCHGRPPNSFGGGFVGDSQILNAPLGSCFAPQVGTCHATHNTAQAHPNAWIGGHQDIELSAIERGCILCHDLTGTGATPLPGSPSCTLCHPQGFGEAG